MRIPARLLVLQLLPILVFLVVDALVQDPLWAIGAALAFVAVQTAVTLIQQRRFDPFILLDAVLIGGLGAVSLLTRNEFFFKLKPAIIEGVLVPLLLFLSLASERVVMGYLGRYSLGMPMNPAVLPVMRRMLGLLCALVVLHAAAVVFAALRLSRQAWAWISGPGFYLLLVPLVAWALVQRLRVKRQLAADQAPGSGEGTEEPPREEEEPQREEEPRQEEASPEPPATGPDRPRSSGQARGHSHGHGRARARRGRSKRRRRR